MNEQLTELYRACRSKEALASQDQFKSANVLMGTEVEKFAESIIREAVRIAELKEQGFQDYDKDVSVGWYIRQYFGVE